MFISEISIVCVLISFLAVNNNFAIKSNFTVQPEEKTVNEKTIRTNATVLKADNVHAKNEIFHNKTLDLLEKNSSREGRSKKIFVLPEARHLGMGGGSSDSGGKGKPRLSFPKVYFTAGVATQTKMSSGGGKESGGGNGGWGSSGGGQRQQSGGAQTGWQIIPLAQSSTQQSGGGWGGGGGSQGGGSSGGGGWGGGSSQGGGGGGGGGWGMMSSGGVGGGGWGGGGGQQQQSQGGWGQMSQGQMGWQMSGGGGGGGGGGWGMQQSKGWGGGGEESSECESKKSKKKKKKKEKKKKKKEKKKKKKKSSSESGGGGGWGWGRMGSDNWMVGKSRNDADLYDDGEEDEESVEIYHLVPVSQGSRTTSPMNSILPVPYSPFSLYNWGSNYPQVNMPMNMHLPMPMAMTQVSETTEHIPSSMERERTMISPSATQRIGPFDTMTNSHESSSSQSDESINNIDHFKGNPITVMECTDPTLCALWKI